ncbi:hypothetical protein [Burkholderia pseudomallei]|uniref:hypothetical protein n=1 Tax=Burkholderia pseudomallei TaxID=28450 RepID=UPI000A1EFA03|nr:hypothetical protein [Burkholderia pseudomallei]OSO81228.1 hypothetical protein BOC56_29345 [Burkholderia pseudomallei]
MTESSNEKQSNLNVAIESSDKAANTIGTFMENALNEQDAIASGNVSADLADAPEPTFLDDEGPSLDVPMFITKTNARELFGLRPGETVAQAAARKAKEG